MADSNDAGALAEAGTVTKAIGDVGEGGVHSKEYGRFSCGWARSRTSGTAVA